jgi:hypothetical protein
MLKNEKRRESCRKVGGIKKKLGHKIEKGFLEKYNNKMINTPTEYGAKADTSISLFHPICEILKKEIGVIEFNVSNKSGKNIQFVLGKIEELKDINIECLNKNFVTNLLNKYLKKNNSDKPANMLVYKDDDKWIFFNVDDIIKYISEKCVWRKLVSGRIKGDFYDFSKKGISQYITYEYRETHKSFFLGLNGNKGKKFIYLLMNKDTGIKYYVDNL